MPTCRNHPGAIALGRCAGCAEEFCKNCLVEIQGQHYCGSCKVMTLNGRIPEAAQAVLDQYRLPNSAATTSLVCGIIGVVMSLICFGVILDIIAIVKAVEAKNDMKRNPQMGGGSAATMGMIFGIIGLCEVGLFVVFNAARH